MSCPKCEGKGGIGAFGPVEQGHMHWKRPCPACRGSRMFAQPNTPCPKCKAKGFAGTFGPVEEGDVHAKGPCSLCQGRCFFEGSVQFNACGGCEGKGGKGAFGPCEPYDTHYKKPCPQCNGQGYSRMGGVGVQVNVTAQPPMMGMNMGMPQQQPMPGMGMSMGMSQQQPMAGMGMNVGMPGMNVNMGMPGMNVSMGVPGMSVNMGMPSVGISMGQPPLDNAIVCIQSVSDGRILDANANGAPQFSPQHPRIFLWQASSMSANSASPNHRWQLRPAGNGSYLIVSASSGLCLDGNTGVPQVDSSHPCPFLWSADPSPNHQWRLQMVGPNTFLIINAANGLCLDGNVNSTRHHSMQHQSPFLWQPNPGSPNHQWRLLF